MCWGSSKLIPAGNEAEDCVRQEAGHQTLWEAQLLALLVTLAAPLFWRCLTFSAGNEAEGCVGQGAETNGVVAAVVTVTFDRADYLKRMLGSLLSVHGSNARNRRASGGWAGGGGMLCGPPQHAQRSQCFAHAPTHHPAAFALLQAGVPALHQPGCRRSRCAGRDSAASGGWHQIPSGDSSWAAGCPSSLVHVH